MRPIDGGDDAGVPSEDPSTKITYDFESSLVTHLELELYQNRGWIQIIDVRLAKGRMFGTLMMMTWSCLGIISSWRAYGPLSSQSCMRFCLCLLLASISSFPLAS